MFLTLMRDKIGMQEFIFMPCAAKQIRENLEAAVIFKYKIARSYADSAKGIGANTL
jgi:hypothetical protein